MKTTVRKIMIGAYRVVNLMVVLTMMISAPTAAFAYTETDREDYAPGSTVTVFGDNSNNAGYLPGETVLVTVTQPVLADPLTCEGVVNEAGAWSCQLVLSADPALAVGLYSYTTLGLTSGVIESHFFTDAAPPSIEQLWQCDPPSVFDPVTYTCESDGNTGWVSGNNDGLFMEGETIPYRTRLQNLVSGDYYSITIEWDTTKSDKHALDYLKSFNATIFGADPCISLTGLPADLCSGTPSTWGIPADTFMQGDAAWIANGGVQDAGEFTMFGGAITGVSAYTTPPSYIGDTSTSITIYFTAASTDIVLAWGGHIAERDDWGMDNSAVAISGSPYHMRILSWYDVTNSASLNVGQMDRSLSTEAVVYPGSITIIKDAIPDSSTSFPFTAGPSPLVDFSLVDDGTTTNTRVFPDIVDFTTYTVTENTPTGWSFGGAVCEVTSPNGGSQTVTDATATIVLKEGENVTCTYTNTIIGQNLTVSKTATPAFGRTYTWDIYKNVDKTTANIPDGGSATFNYTVGVTHDSGTDSGFVVSGVITVTNPNAFDVVADVTDSAPYGVCTVTNGEDVTIPASSFVERNYTCTFASNPGSGTNTATATWDPATYYTPGSSASGTANYNFATVSPSITNGSVTVTDTLGGNLGTASYTETSPKEFTYSHTFYGVGGTCTNYDNTATITENGDFASQQVEVCVGQDLTVTKTASASKDRMYNWLIDKSVDDTRIEISEGGTATFNYSVKVTPNGYTDSGYTLGGTITITNPNDWEDITVSVADTLDLGGTCNITEAEPYVVPTATTSGAGSLTLHYTCDSDGTTTKNTVAVTWDAATYFTPTSSASDDADVSFALDVETNKTITVIDDKTDPSNPVTLGTWDWSDGEHTFTYSLSKAGVAGTCTDYTNIAVIDETDQSDSQTVTVCVGKDLTVTKTAAGTFNRVYLWSINKSVDDTRIEIANGGTATFNYTVQVTQTGISDSGWILSGVITIANPNDWEAITLTGLTDVVNNDGVCTVDAGPYVVPASGSIEVNYSCSYAAAPTSYSGRNTATATWAAATYFTPSGTASGGADFTLSQVGATNKTVHVTDTYAGALGTVTATDAAPWASATFNYQRATSGVPGACTTYDNTATITETGQNDEESVEVCVGLDLTVSKTASGTFNRTYHWLIDKSVDDTLIEIAEGGLATFNYTVEVTANGYTDSGWTMGGTITVSNPNAWEAITADVTDSFPGGVCTVTGGEDVVVPASGSVTLNYSCTFASQPGYTGTNTATATWDAATYFTPTGTASGTAGVTLGLSGETYRTITVIDDKTDPAHPVTLGTSDYYSGPFEYTYSLSKAGVAGTCTDYTNIAVIDETDQSDSQTVTVCVGKDLTVTKTATPTFTRTWTWEIVKDYDGSYTMFAGDSVSHGYKVSVDPTPTDSLWSVVGVITISNPNDWEDITASVSDATDLGGSCSITESTPYVVPKGGSLELHYTCTWATLPASYTGTNTATVTWDSATYFTPSNTATGTAGFVFDNKTAGNPTEVNPVITVDDNNLTGEDWSANRAAGEWTYNKPFVCSTNPADYTNGTYSYSHTNTATITETGQYDTATVDVTCYWPQIELTKTGDDLSKITDKVYYDITLTNNTPESAGLRALSCSISDPTIGFSKSVTLASGAFDANLDIEFTIPNGAADPFVNMASVTCAPVAATAPVVGSSTFSVGDTASWSTNLFQPAVEILKSGPANATPEQVITYTFTINNLSSDDSPNLVLDSVSDNVLGDLMTEALAAGCNNLAYNGTCTFTKEYTIPGGPTPPALITNVVTVHFHPTGFPNDIHDVDDHTVTLINEGQLTDTSYCPLPNNQFRLLYHNETVDTYRLQSSNPGQFYYNAFYFGEPGESITMTIEIPYPFITQEGAGNPIQVHDGSGMTSSGCYAPWPSVPGFDITTYAMTPTSPAGNQIITPEDYTTKTIGSPTTVTVSGVVPASGVVYVTIHLDYGLKKTGGWMRGTQTLNPVSGLLYYDMTNSALGLTILGLQPYHFERTVGADTVGTDPESFNEVKKVNGFQGWVTSLDTGDPIVGVKVKIKDPYGVVLGTVYTDGNGYYRLPYNTIKNGLIYTVKFPDYLVTFKVTRPKGAPAIITNLEIP